MDQLVVLIVILLIGAWFSWRDISKGRGWLCRFLSAETLQSLNSDGGRVKKALLSIDRWILSNGIDEIKQ